MKRSLIAIAAAVSLTALSAVAQQTPPAQPGSGMGQGMGPMHGQANCPMGAPVRGGMHGRGGWMQGQGFAQLDADKDGKVSKDEMTAQFERLDANKDGQLSRDEIHAYRLAQGGEGFARLDANKDGAVSRDEAKSAPRLAQNFDALDANKDGQLSRDELRSAWAGRRQHHGPRMDVNGDGMISRDEAKSAPMLSQNFDAIDANKDGSLTRDEMHAWRRAQSPAATAPVKP
jgi:Ca2+-binding EF-hand superfamily protein